MRYDALGSLWAVDPGLHACSMGFKIALATWRSSCLFMFRQKRCGIADAIEQFIELARIEVKLVNSQFQCRQTANKNEKILRNMWSTSLALVGRITPLKALLFFVIHTYPHLLSILRFRLRNTSRRRCEQAALRSEVQSQQDLTKAVVTCDNATDT